MSYSKDRMDFTKKVSNLTNVLITDRGEGGNHSLFDVFKFVSNMLPVLQSAKLGDPSPEMLQKACDTYEEELIARGSPAVLRSRQACLDAHNPLALNDKSPLVSKRAPYIMDDNQGCLSQLKLSAWNQKCN